MSNAATVLYDAPGPVTRRRQRILSLIVGLVIIGVLVLATLTMYRNGIFNDRWRVLVDPPRNQTVKNVWWDSLLWRGLILGTLRAALTALPLAAILALILVVLRTAKSGLLRRTGMVLIEILRGLPVLVIMLIANLVFGYRPFQAVVIGLTLYNAAVFAEIIRAGLAALAKGQGEAGTAIGLSASQNFFLITFPQAIRVMMPSLVAQMVVLLKDTSIGFIIGYWELLESFRNNYNFFGQESRIPLFVATLAIYLVVNFTVSRIAIVLERRLRERGQRVKAPTAIAMSANPAQTGSSV